MKEKTRLFWEIYDKYISTEDSSLRGKLSELLAQIENVSKKNQILRPEKGWNEILAWQALRDERFIFTKEPKWVYEGEIIISLPHWDRDVFITRSPREEFVSGHFLKPGYHLSSEDKGDRSDYEWDYFIITNGIVDERGLYLPLYDSDVVLKFCDNYIEEKKKKMLKYLEIEKGWT
jgi:hypothetical protein